MDNEPRHSTGQKKPSQTVASLLAEPDSDSDDDQDCQQQGSIERELALYVSLPAADAKLTDPLVWWREHCSTFPSLALLAERYLCVPATSVPFERDFSVAGNIVTSKRNCLKPAKVNELCFLACNLRRLDMWSRVGIEPT